MKGRVLAIIGLLLVFIGLGLFVLGASRNSSSLIGLGVVSVIVGFLFTRSAGKRVERQK